jgi:hypothetical protein
MVDLNVTVSLLAIAGTEVKTTDGTGIAMVENASQASLRITFIRVDE